MKMFVVVVHASGSVVNVAGYRQNCQFDQTL